MQHSRFFNWKIDDVKIERHTKPSNNAGCVGLLLIILILFYYDSFEKLKKDLHRCNKIMIE